MSGVVGGCLSLEKDEVFKGGDKDSATSTSTDEDVGSEYIQPQDIYSKNDDDDTMSKGHDERGCWLAEEMKMRRDVRNEVGDIAPETSIPNINASKDEEEEYICTNIINCKIVPSKDTSVWKRMVEKMADDETILFGAWICGPRGRKIGRKKEQGSSKGQE